MKKLLHMKTNGQSEHLTEKSNEELFKAVFNFVILDTKVTYENFMFIK